MCDKWIKLSDKLPPCDAEVLLLYETGEMTLYERGGDDLSEHDPKFTHWMPKPELPED